MIREDVERYGATARGKRELLKYLDGGRLTRKQAMLAKCFECCNGYSDGKTDCRVRLCPLYAFMPYASPKKRPAKELSPGTRVELRERLKEGRKRRFSREPEQQ